MNLLLPCTAEQDQRQFGGGQGIGAGVVALEHFQLEPVDPFVQSGLADVRLRTEQRGNVRHVQKGVLQFVAQMIFQRPAKHVLVEWRMKRQQRTVADELHEIEQRLGRIAAGGDRTGADAVNQHAGT
ncbi:hypothetical protein D3C71_1035630 [compost metagenome]